MGHNFNLPVELELTLVKNCIEAAILIIMAMTSGDEFYPNETILVMDDSKANQEFEIDPYIPKFRMMEDNQSVLESTMSLAVDTFEPSKRITFQATTESMLENDFPSRLLWTDRSENLQVLSDEPIQLTNVNSRAVRSHATVQHESGDTLDDAEHDGPVESTMVVEAPNNDNQ
jgi:hypothetical protein